MRRVKKAPATRIDGVQHFCIELNSCEDNDFYASGTFLLYLNCCIVLCPVLCTLHLKADYICSHIPVHFRNDCELDVN